MTMVFQTGLSGILAQSKTHKTNVPAAQWFWGFPSHFIPMMCQKLSNSSATSKVLADLLPARIWCYSSQEKIQFCVQDVLCFRLMMKEWHHIYTRKMMVSTQAGVCYEINFCLQICVCTCYVSLKNIFSKQNNHITFSSIIKTSPIQ